MNDLLRRAWDALDLFKQAYPESWSEDDEKLLNDLMRADLKLSGVKLNWKGLTQDEIWEIPTLSEFAQAIEAKLKERNT